RARSRAEQGGAAQNAKDKCDKLRVALVTMGFKKTECCKVVAALGTEAERLPLDQLIREALRRLTPR
ncbi:MAG: Holliday junction branch migration protein RuvA, partial [Myxococcales bacterium]|nr:Holliday junction branch migration protein RuvA [Myxococcales bacterium]